MTLKEVSEEYFTHRKDNSVTKSDKCIFEIYILPYFKGKLLSLITSKDIMIWKLKLNQRNLKNYNRKLSPKYKNDVLSLMISINIFALKYDFTENDFKKYITKEKIDNNRERFLSLSEIKKLYEHTIDNDTLYLFCKIALNTGARLGTILNIQQRDIDSDHRLLTLKDYKSNSTYKIPIADSLLVILQNNIKMLSSNDYIIQKAPSKVLRQTLNELFNVGINTLDRKNKIVIHSLRHTFASHLAINGTPIYNISKLLNHKDISMTMRYAKLTDDSNRKYLENLKF
jgi:integrase